MSSTVKLFNKYLKHFLSWSFGIKGKHKLLKGGKENEEREIIKLDQFVNGLKKVKEKDYELYLFLFIVFNTGARRGALLKLKFSDIK